MHNYLANCLFLKYDETRPSLADIMQQAIEMHDEERVQCYSFLSFTEL